MNCAELPIYQGDDFAAEVEVMLEDAATPADLTGYTARAQIRFAPADDDEVVVAELVCTVAGPGLITMTLGRAETRALRGRYVWDLEITAPDGVNSTIIGGPAIALAEVTR